MKNTVSWQSNHKKGAACGVLRLVLRCGVLRLVLRVGCCVWGAAAGAACGVLAGAACGVLRCGQWGAAAAEC